VYPTGTMAPSLTLEERLNQWRLALRLVDHIARARCAIHNIQDHVNTPALGQADLALEEEYDKQQDIIWLHSKDAVLRGTEDDQEKMNQWAMECDQQWDGSEWIPID